MLAQIKDFHSQLVNDMYTFLGSFSDGDAVVFRVWAPNAEQVSVVGDFNDWNKQSNIMNRLDNGVFELSVKGLSKFDNYKYAITAAGNTVFKSDPFARHFETAPSNSSKFYEDSYKWTDRAWLSEREEKDIYSSPVNIYEVHLGSFMRYENGNAYRFS